MSYEWTELTYQRILAGTPPSTCIRCASCWCSSCWPRLYESFRLPLAIILIVPMCLLFAIAGVWLKGSDNNIFTQIGLIVLVGLACKNAILIVEFAKRKAGRGLCRPWKPPSKPAACGCVRS
jgi:multidrug efflux pump